MVDGADWCRRIKKISPESLWEVYLNSLKMVRSTSSRRVYSLSGGWVVCHVYDIPRMIFEALAVVSQLKPSPDECAIVSTRLRPDQDDGERSLDATIRLGVAFELGARLVRHVQWEGVLVHICINHRSSYHGECLRRLV